jgi:hypothetical protein
MVDDKTLPNLLRPVKTTSPVSIPAMSYSFIVLPDAQLPVCMWTVNKLSDTCQCWTLKVLEVILTGQCPIINVDLSMSIL